MILTLNPSANAELRIQSSLTAPFKTAATSAAPTSLRRHCSATNPGSSHQPARRAILTAKNMMNIATMSARVPPRLHSHVSLAWHDMTIVERRFCVFEK